VKDLNSLTNFGRWLRVNRDQWRRHRAGVLGGVAASAALALALPAGAVAVASEAADATETADATSSITIDGTSGGRTFDGVGAVSGGGATSRLLLDYPEEERDEVLDYLFLPGYGASLDLLKVEVGGDTNSTDGSESSHAHARGEVNCNAGYEWWLMKEAVERNPEMNLGGLAWGAPGWLSSYYSQDTIDYFIDWLDCAAEHGLTIDNMGVRNEREYESEWIKEYRAALDAAGYEDVRIIASDEAARKGEWPIAVDMANDPELYDAVGLLGNHYSTGPSSATAQSLNKPLWISEGGPWSGEWGAGGSARSIPSLLNHAYIEGRITGVQIWNLLTAYYDGLSISDAGLMRSNTPWSGAYQVQSAIWAVAQSTQFTEPGWQYLDASSGYLDGEGRENGSYVSLRSPDGEDWSTVIESIGTTEARDVSLSVTGGLAAGDLHVWQTTADDWFVQQPDLVPAADGTYTLTVPANSTVTVTTTAGQAKGDAVGAPESAFPFPYRNDLSDGGPSGQTPYFSQMEGAYEERDCQGGREGTCLTQVSPQPAIGWAPWKKPAGILGDLNWNDYSVSVDAWVPDGGTAQVLGRVSNDAMQPVPNGYGLSLAADGTWSIGRGVPGGRSWLELTTGTTGSDGTGWHDLSLAFDDDRIIAEIDGARVGEVTDATWVSGMAGLSGDYSAVQFADLAIEPLEPVVSTDAVADSMVFEGDGWQHCTSGPGRQDDCSGFSVSQVASADAGTMAGSNRAGDAVEFTFEGTQATLVGASGPRGGEALVSIDGNEPTALSFREGGAGGEAVWRSPVLVDGAHTLRLEVVSDDDGNRGWVGVDRVEVVPGDGGPSSVDDQSEGSGLGRFDYQGSWLSCPGCINRTQLFHASVTSTAVVGDSVDLRFVGTGVDLFGLRASNQGIAQVLIDGVEVGSADFYGKVRVGNQLIWSSEDLEPGVHTLTLVATGTENPSASGADINVDRVVVRP
jgi:O-glycosyl hydrolase